MMYPVVAKVSHLISEGDARAAETALVAFAESEGDVVLSQVIETMPAADLIAILREHDSSCSSIVGELISPEAFLAALALDAKYNDKTHDALRGMINAVIFRDGDPDPFIEAMGRAESGILALVSYFSDYDEEIDWFFRNGAFDSFDADDQHPLPADDSDLVECELGISAHQPKVELNEVRDGDWHELAWRLRYDHFETFGEVLRLLRGRTRKLAATTPKSTKGSGTPSDDEDDDDEDVL